MNSINFLHGFYWVCYCNTKHWNDELFQNQFSSSDGFYLILSFDSRFVCATNNKPKFISWSINGHYIQSCSAILPDVIILWTIVLYDIHVESLLLGINDLYRSQTNVHGKNSFDQNFSAFYCNGNFSWHFVYIFFFISF